MATLSMDLTNKCTEAEMALAQKLQVAALTKDMDESPNTSGESDDQIAFSAWRP